MSEEKAENTQGEVIIYQTDEGDTKIDVRFVDETVWLTQAQLVELFQSSKANISEHIKNIYDEGELDEESTVRKFRTVQIEGERSVTRSIVHYNLDMIISLGYRVKSKIATHFRKWATERLKEYMIKGFTMDDERLKNLGGGNYWKELLDRIRDIRSSEKVMYRQVWICMPQALTTTLRVPNRSHFSKWFKTSSIMQLTGTQQLKSYTNEQMLKSHLWD